MSVNVQINYYGEFYICRKTGIKFNFTITPYLLRNTIDLKNIQFTQTFNKLMVTFTHNIQTAFLSNASKDLKCNIACNFH